MKGKENTDKGIWIRKNNRSISSLITKDQWEDLLPPDSNTNAKTSTVVLGNVCNIIAPSKALWSIDENSLWSDPYGKGDQEIESTNLKKIIKREIKRLNQLCYAYNLIAPLKLHTSNYLIYLSSNWSGKCCIADITI